MGRFFLRGALASVAVIGLFAATFAAPAHSDFYEVTLTDSQVAAISTSNRLNLTRQTTNTRVNAWAEAPADLQDPFMHRESTERQRRVEPLFVVKF